MQHHGRYVLNQEGELLQDGNVVRELSYKTVAKLLAYSRGVVHYCVDSTCWWNDSQGETAGKPNGADQ